MALCNACLVKRSDTAKLSTPTPADTKGAPAPSMAAVGRKRIKPEVRIRVAERFGWVCCYCFEPIPRERPAGMSARRYRRYSMLSIDHIRPVWAGGTDEERNLQPMHMVCNISAGPKRLDLAITAEEIELGKRVWFEVYRQEQAVRRWRARGCGPEGLRRYIDNRLGEEDYRRRRPEDAAATVPRGW